MASIDKGQQIPLAVVSGFVWRERQFHSLPCRLRRPQIKVSGTCASASLCHTPSAIPQERQRSCLIRGSRLSGNAGCWQHEGSVDLAGVEGARTAASPAGAKIVDQPISTHGITYDTGIRIQQTAQEMVLVADNSAIRRITKRWSKGRL